MEFARFFDLLNATAGDAGVPGQIGLTEVERDAPLVNRKSQLPDDRTPRI